MAAALTRPPIQASAGFEDRTIRVPAPFRLESGDVLDAPTIRVRLHGPAAAPIVLALGGISATRRLNGADGWWGDIVGPGAAIDTNRFCALGVDFAPDEDQLVRISPTDQARLIEAALDDLGIGKIHAAVGASYGGMVGLALAQIAPQRLSRLCVISTAHQASPLGAAWRGVQRRIVEFAQAQGEASAGLSLARQLAMISYRSAEEFETRFDRRLGSETESDLDRYLVSRGEAFCASMPAKRWLSLSGSIDRAAIDPTAVQVPTTLIACTSDQLAPLAQMEELSRRLPKLTAFHVLTSLYGHDAFLKEPAQISRALRRFLDETGNG